MPILYHVSSCKAKIIGFKVILNELQGDELPFWTGIKELRICAGQ